MATVLPVVNGRYDSRSTVVEYRVRGTTAGSPAKEIFRTPDSGVLARPAHIELVFGLLGCAFGRGANAGGDAPQYVLEDYTGPVNIGEPDGWAAGTWYAPYDSYSWAPAPDQMAPSKGVPGTYAQYSGKGDRAPTLSAVRMVSARRSPLPVVKLWGKVYPQLAQLLCPGRGWVDHHTVTVTLQLHEIAAPLRRVELALKSRPTLASFLRVVPGKARGCRRR
jgi:hypothetical protein